MNSLSIRKINEVSKKKKKGFTLVELIIVIAIIAILAAIAIPKFGQVTRNANAKADIATAKNIYGITAQLVAEGTAPTEATIAAKIDGASSTTVLPNTKLNSAVKFVVVYSSTDGSIKVTDSSATAVNIYPDSSAWK